jgi:Kef-type K+ transport system membrane component KefB
MLYGFPMFPDGLSAGTALAPTSVGIALKLLTEKGCLNKEFGQTIMTAAFVDDIFSLILYNILFSMGTGEITFMGTFFWSIMGVTFMILAVGAAIMPFPMLVKHILERIPKKPVDDSVDPPVPRAKVSQEKEALFLIMAGTLVAYAQITYICGTHLWGCFIAGMSFSKVHVTTADNCPLPKSRKACEVCHGSGRQQDGTLDCGHCGGGGREPYEAVEIWVTQTKRLTTWMIRIFFSCTVAFSIPLSKLMSFDAFWKGSFMGIGPCIATKVCCAFFMGAPKFVIGWAMVGRAEFAYLIAQMAMTSNMMSKDLFAIAIWSLLWATVFAPVVFNHVLTGYSKTLALDEDEMRRSHSNMDNVDKGPGRAMAPDTVGQAHHTRGLNQQAHHGHGQHQQALHGHGQHHQLVDEHDEEEESGSESFESESGSGSEEVSSCEDPQDAGPPLAGRHQQRRH